MPYKRKGSTVLHKKNGWTKKAKAKSPARAKRMMNLLRGVEHGWTPTGKKARDIRKKGGNPGLKVVIAGWIPEHKGG